ncbi:MAG TPA: M23 family metallopeptidase [Flavisolibacter sp.]
MKNLSTVLVLVALMATSCRSAIPSIFNRKTPHETYADKLEDRDLDKTPAGQAWLEASRRAVTAPHAVDVPYSHAGQFHADKARALGLRFTAKKGEKVSFTVRKQPATGFVIYADLYRVAGTEAVHLHAADTAATGFSIDIEETGNYVLRLQSELFRAGKYTLQISSGPSLSFPVSGKANIGSFWGDERDGGKRRHEGIDIFAPRKTPLMAAADGVITSVREGGIGGKTVWLRPSGKNYSLYYAHLDQQHVREGQFVKAGEIIGTVGNTGNARTTPPHLHFGIYTHQGAVDPLPFVKRVQQTPSPLPAKDLPALVRVTKNHRAQPGKTIKARSVFVPVAMTAKGYLSEMPDGTLVTIPFSAAKPVTFREMTRLTGDSNGSGGS